MSQQGNQANQKYTPTRVWAYVWAQSITAVLLSTMYFPFAWHRLGGGKDDYVFLMMAILAFSFFFTVFALQELTGYEGFQKLIPASSKRVIHTPSVKYDYQEELELLGRYVRQRWSPRDYPY